ncbi:hypothetical protein SO802_007130 [Lithocarpus litseifolius]|uniref:Uncharacterized protein n=1 Tax=Lithocarpus litseifolius TaxID=425828 RepID=A0AAW2DMS0_9ROSI
MEPLYSSDDENRPSVTESIQIQNSELDPQCKAAQRKLQRSVVKLFKENRGGNRADPPSKTCSGKFNTPSRPDTPTVSTIGTTIASRFRRSTTNMSATGTGTAAAKLLQSSGLSLSISAQPSDSSDDTNHNLRPNCTARSLPDFRSSVPEADRLMSEKNCSSNRGVNGSSDSLKFSAPSPCSRSLNLPLSSGGGGGEKPSNFALPKPYTNSVKTSGGLSLPPVPPPCSKSLGAGNDARKVKKVLTHQENVHTLRLLHNRYLQWRFANAKREASMQAQQRECERTLYSLGVKISELFDSVKKKRIELGLLQRTKTLSTVLDAQIPYLEEWSALEEDYSVSLSEAIQALLNASLQLPIGNVRADIREIGEALNSATNMMEMIVFHLQSFVPKAEETENLISELARVTGGEKALIGECGGLLSKTYASQVEEFSLRGQLIQLHHCSHKDNLVKTE